MEIQAQIPAALCTMHNYICVHDPTNGNLPADDGDNEDGYLEDGPADVVAEEDVTGVHGFLNGGDDTNVVEGGFMDDM
jgi:hypothetical protein